MSKPTVNRYHEVMKDLRENFSERQYLAIEHFVDLSLEDHIQAIDALREEVESLEKRLDNI